jgi:Ecdysteroid kinase-like family
MEGNAWPELNQPEFIDRIDEMIAKCTERGRRVYSPAAGGFNVLNHGDFFLRNMLFRDIDGKICDVQFVSTEEEEECGSEGRQHFSLPHILVPNVLFHAEHKNNQSCVGGLLQFCHHLSPARICMALMQNSEQVKISTASSPAFAFQLDFQLSVYASPAVDIFMALYGSMTLKNRKTYRNEIIQFYYETFATALKDFGYGKEPPSFSDLKLELTKNGALGAQLCICYVPYLIAEWSQIDFNVMYNVNEDAETAKKNLYLSPKFGEVIQEEFHDFFSNGCI